MLTIVRASVANGGWAEEVIREIVECRMLREIETGVDEKIKGSKRHEQSRILREIFYEWYSIRHAYKK
jgi:hypothetical protein